MARYTLATKTSEVNHVYMYEICNDSKAADCYAVLDGNCKNIKIYLDQGLT